MNTCRFSSFYSGNFLVLDVDDDAASVTPAALFAEIVELKKKINKLESDFKSKSDELTLLRNFRKLKTMAWRLDAFSVGNGSYRIEIDLSDALNLFKDLFVGNLLAKAAVMGVSIDGARLRKDQNSEEDILEFFTTNTFDLKNAEEVAKLVRLIAEFCRENVY